MGCVSACLLHPHPGDTRNLTWESEMRHPASGLQNLPRAGHLLPSLLEGLFQRQIETCHSPT